MLVPFGGGSFLARLGEPRGGCRATGGITPLPRAPRGAARSSMSPPQHPACPHGPVPATLALLQRVFLGWGDTDTRQGRDPNDFVGSLGRCGRARQAASPPGTAAWGGGCVSKNRSFPSHPPAGGIPGGGCSARSPRDEGTRPCSDSWESRPLHAQAFYGAPPGSPELINPPRKRWYSREKGFWSPAPVRTGLGLGLSPPGGSQRCHRRAVGRCAAGGRRAVPTQPPPARPRSLINLVISSLAGLRAWSPGWEQHRCSTGVLQGVQDGAPPRVSATPYHPPGVWGDLFHS